MNYNILYYTNKMTAKVIRYTLEDFNNLIFNGFNYELPSETLKIISELSLEVGSPSYVKTPIFQKKENPIKTENGTGTGGGGGFKKKKGKNMEINDNDWETLRTFQATKIEERVGINSEIDNIRSHLNKLSDKNYIDIRNKIMDIIDNVFNNNESPEDIKRVSLTIFEIASTNRFYSKMYADLYCDIITNYEIDPDTGENLGKSQLKIAQIEISEVLPQKSLGHLVGSADGIQIGFIVRQSPPMVNGKIVP